MIEKQLQGEKVNFNIFINMTRGKNTSIDENNWLNFASLDQPNKI